MEVGGLYSGGVGQQLAATKQEIGTAVVKQQLDAEGAAPLAILNSTENAVKAATPSGVGENVDRSV